MRERLARCWCLLTCGWGIDVGVERPCCCRGEGCEGGGEEKAGKVEEEGDGETAERAERQGDGEGVKDGYAAMGMKIG